MKKTLCLIYRLAFIIFGLWAFLEAADYSVRRLPELLVSMAFLIDFVCLIVISVGFFILLHRQPPDIYFVIQFAATLLAVWLFVQNVSDFLSIFSSGWLIRVLLPAMAILDWLLFGKRGVVSLLDALLSLLGALAILALASWLFGNLLRLPGLGLNSLKDWLDLIGKIALAAAAMYLLDRLFSSGLKHINNWFCLLWRLIFLILEGWAFYTLCRGDLLNLVRALKYFGIIANALGFLFMAVSLILFLLKAGETGKKGGAFLRVKGMIMVCMAIVLIYALVVTKQKAEWLSVPFAHGVLCPILFLADWLFFDKKGAFKAYDPFMWLIVPAVYYVAAALVLKPFYGINLYPALFGANPFVFIGAGVLTVLAAGYILLAADVLLKRK